MMVKRYYIQRMEKSLGDININGWNTQQTKNIDDN